MIDAFNGKHAVIMADLSAAKSAEQAINRAEEALGPIDILVNNAGIIRRSDALDFSEDDWDDVMATNLKSPFFMARAAARSMLAGNRPGKIINIALFYRCREVFVWPHILPAKVDWQDLHAS